MCGNSAPALAPRRSAAAILGLGTVLPGPDGEAFAPPDPPGFRPGSSGPRPALKGGPT
jgi:hypothetical protein